MIEPDDVKMVRADRDFFWWSDPQEVIGKIVIRPDDWDVHDLDWVGSRLILKRSPGEWGLKAKLYNVADSEWMEAEAITSMCRQLW